MIDAFSGVCQTDLPQTKRAQENPLRPTLLGCVRPAWTYRLTYLYGQYTHLPLNVKKKTGGNGLREEAKLFSAAFGPLFQCLARQLLFAIFFLRRGHSCFLTPWPLPSYQALQQLYLVAIQDTSTLCCNNADLRCTQGKEHQEA